MFTVVLISCLILLPATHTAYKEPIIKNSYQHLYRELDLLQLSAYAKALHLVEQHEPQSIDKYSTISSSTIRKPEHQTSSPYAKSLHLEEQYDTRTIDQSLGKIIPITTKAEYQTSPVYTQSWHLMKQYDPTTVPIYAKSSHFTEEYDPTIAYRSPTKNIPTMRETEHHPSPTYAKSLHFVEQYAPTTADQSPARIFQMLRMTSQPTASYDYLQLEPIVQHQYHSPLTSQQVDRSSKQYNPNSGYHYPHP